MNTPNLAHSSLSGLSAIATRPLSAALLATALLVAGGSAVSAETIFYDDFSGIAPSTGQQSDGLNSIGWYFYNANAAGGAYTVGTSSVSPLSGGVLANNGGTASNSWALKSFSAVSLTNPGDALTLQFDFHLVNNATDTNFQFLSAGFYNASSAITANAFGSNPLAGANGYYGNQHAKPTAQAATFFEVTGGSANAIGTSSGTSILGLNANAHTIALTLERVATGLALTWTVDNVVVGSMIDLAPVTYTFNTVRLSMPGGGTGAFPAHIDNVSVTTGAVPEPSSVAVLLGVFALAFCVFLRRK